ncbi:MAG: chromophore lyase CpcT/CpeT [Saprospiraceae bacterium]|nr:chromophore lyase CpcT/CpeT [Saprospiraceae bacterium]
MTRLIPFAFLAVASTLSWHCSRSLSAKSADKDLAMLVQYMVGDFSSLEQSKKDSAFFDIRLHIRPIWTSDAGNHWLYVEQATATAESKPYRQRIYKVERDGRKGFKSIVYTLPDQAKWAGKYHTPEVFDALKPSDLSLREGCTVFLERQKNGSFTGSTKGDGCESNLRGAKYATSTVTITDKMLLSWDQGFNENGEQVWGATKGGYEFLKR